MSHQPLDLRGSAQIVRQRKSIVAIIFAIGLVLGAGIGAIAPPLQSAKAIVLLPGAPSMATQVLIATSNPVLESALQDISPQPSLTTLRHELQAQSLSGSIVSITANASTGAQAERVANAVANSYVAYVGSPGMPIGRLAGRVLEPAISASGTSRAAHLTATTVAGGLGGLLVGVIASITLGRRDRRLRTRDQIADAIGVPVLASVPVDRPSSAAEWLRLVGRYEPSAVYAWRLRKTLQALALEGLDLTGSGDPGEAREPASVAVLSLSTDPTALSLGPQLAAYAASLGIPTCLAVAAQEEAVTSALRIACAGSTGESVRKPADLWLAVADGKDPGSLAGSNGLSGRAMLIVFVAVIDPRVPRLVNLMPTATTLLGVSASAVTADHLARAAVAAASDGREVVGLLVANPSAEDNTTGRLPRLPRPMRAGPAIVRATGSTTEVRR
jgi:hypothetical protein